MVKRRNLKRRDTEVEGEGSGSDRTLSAVENERDSGDESDMGAREGANTRRENANFGPPLARREDLPLQVDGEDPGDDQGLDGLGVDNDEQAVGDAARPRVRENNEVTAAMKEMTRALVDTIKESNRAMSQNLNHVLEEVQRRQPQGQVTPARMPPGRTDGVCRPRPRARQPRYSRSGFSDSDEESGMYSTHRQSLYRDPAQQRETTKLPIFTGKEPWNVWFNRFTEVADRRRWSEDDRLDEILPRLQGAAGEFVFGQLRREVRTNYAQLVSELNSRFRVVVTKKTYGAQFSHRSQKSSESVEEYAAELKRLYDKAHANRDEETRREDLLRKFLDGLYDEKARFQVEYVKEPRDIDEAVYQVLDFQETRHRPLMTDSSSDRRGKKHVRSVSFAATDCEDSDDEGEEPEYKEKRAKRKRKTRARRAGPSQTSVTEKSDLGKQSEKCGQAPGPSSGEQLEKTLKALQDKIDSLEKQLQRRGNGTFSSRGNPDVVCYTCSEVGHYSRDCPQKQQGRGSNHYFNQQSNGAPGAYQRRGQSYSQNGGYRQSFQGVGPSSSQSLN